MLDQGEDLNVTVMLPAGAAWATLLCQLGPAGILLSDTRRLGEAGAKDSLLVST